MQNSGSTNDSNSGQSIIEQTVYQMFIVAVTLLALAITVVYYFVPLRETVREVLFILNILFSPILLYDFIAHTYHARNHRVKYLVTIGWLDLVGALPGLPLLRFARIPGLWVALRELRHSTAAETRMAARQRLAESSLLVITLLVLLVVSAGSILIVVIEAPVEGANIKTGSDAVWWSIVTVATIGYGDRYPVTNYGRVIGTITIVMGVGLFSVFTSYLATQFMARRRGSGPSDSELLRKEIVTHFDALHKQAAEEKAANAALRAELVQLHDSIAKHVNPQRPDATVLPRDRAP